MKLEMNAKQWPKLIGATAVVLACLNAHAQPQSAGSNPAVQAVTASSQTDADLRTANRQLA